MTRDAVRARLAEILADLLDQDEIILHDETVSTDVEGWDSTVQLQLLLSAERAFGIQFDTEQMDDLVNVGALVDGIMNIVNA